MHTVELPNGTKRPSLFRLAVRPSPVHGVGIFALEAIPAGVPIAEYVGGTEMSYAEFVERYGHDWRYTYHRPPWLPQTVNKHWRQRNISNFVNDGKHGRKRSKVNVHHRGGWLRSSKRIPAGAELLLDYGDAYWRSHK